MDHIGERFAGVDWATDAHAVCVVDAAGRGARRVRRRAHRRPGWPSCAGAWMRRGAAGRDRAARRAGGRGAARRRLRGRCGLQPGGQGAAGALWRRGQQMRPRRRLRAGGTACATDGHRWAALEPDSPATVSLRAHVRTRKDLVTARVAAANQLRAHLRVTFPAAVGLFSRIDSAISLRFLQRFPSVARARWLSPKRLSAWLGANHYSGRNSAEELHRRLTAAAPGIDGEDHSSVTLAYVAVPRDHRGPDQRTRQPHRGTARRPPRRPDLQVPAQSRNHPSRHPARGDRRLPSQIPRPRIPRSPRRSHTLHPILGTPPQRRLQMGLRQTPARRPLRLRRRQPTRQRLGPSTATNNSEPTANATPTPNASSPEAGPTSSGESGKTTPPTTPPDTEPTNTSAPTQVRHRATHGPLGPRPRPYGPSSLPIRSAS